MGPNATIVLPSDAKHDLKLTEGQKILLNVYPNRIILQKIDSLEEILSQPSKAKISYQVLKNMGNEFD